MEKNNLDNLFKEKFKDFSETPEERVWENIEASLDKRKKKRVVPIWWQLGGAAAALALLFYFINPFTNEENTTTPNVVDIETEAPLNSEDGIQNNDTESKIYEEPQNTQVVDNTKEEPSNENSAKQQIQSYGASNNDLRITTEERSALKLSEGIVAQENKEKKNGLVSPQNILNNDPNELSSKRNSEVVTINENKESDETLLNPYKIEEETNEVVITENKGEEDKKSIYDAIAEQEAQEKMAVADKTDKRWAMGPTIAPVFFSSIGEGSPIHSNFAPNAKSGNLNLSYGLTVSYNINKKLSVRSGVHRVDYGYDTNDVVFTSSLTTSTNQLIDNITYAQTSRNLVVESKSNSSSFATNNDAGIGGQAQPLEGRMVQQLGYVEVPLELNYALLDKKFGINLIGGVSSLFLVDNAVILESNQLITEMGEANNANDVNFSTNIGLGFNYEISQRLQLNVEPIFKYQLNTFSESAGNFRPYAVGVYSGLNFRF